MLEYRLNAPKAAASKNRSFASVSRGLRDDAKRRGERRCRLGRGKIGETEKDGGAEQAEKAPEGGACRTQGVAAGIGRLGLHGLLRSFAEMGAGPVARHCARELYSEGRRFGYNWAW